MLHKFDLSSKVIYVSGGATGIGKELIINLLKSQATVIVGYLEEQQEYVDNMKQENDNSNRLFFFPGNIKDKDYSQKLEIFIKQRWKTIDACINNAANLIPDLMQTSTLDCYKDLIENNLVGMMRISERLKYLINPGGRIINISSCITTITMEGAFGYIVSKCALEGYTENLAVELANKNITVNAIAPGFTQTQILSFFLKSKRMKAKIIKHIPVNRMAHPNDIVPIILFILSDSAKYITGQLINVDGGYSI